MLPLTMGRFGKARRTFSRRGPSWRRRDYQSAFFLLLREQRPVEKVRGAARLATSSSLLSQCIRREKTKSDRKVGGQGLRPRYDGGSAGNS